VVITSGFRTEEPGFESHPGARNLSFSNIAVLLSKLKMNYAVGFFELTVLVCCYINICLINCYLTKPRSDP
jgi:hypothetical protein